MDYKNKPRLNGYENVRISHENNKRHCITKRALDTTLFPLVTKREHDSDWLNANNLTDCKH